MALTPATGRLLDRGRCCLAVIDVQEFFLAKLPVEQREPLVGRIAWLMRAALVLEIPLLATGEDIPRIGRVVPEIESLLPAGATAHNKMVFDLMGQADIRAAVAATGRDQFVLTGLESDVCVTHSAFGLMAAGYEVAVAVDACASPPPHHETAIQRLRAAGVIITTVKAVYYDWLRDVATLARVRAQMGGSLPPGLTL
jgi:nicotinamidase-related amidase